MRYKRALLLDPQDAERFGVSVKSEYHCVEWQHTLFLMGGDGIEPPTSRLFGNAPKHTGRDVPV